MRLWTCHPKYLDGKGLVALWREGLLAKAVLEGKTNGYRNHPQLHRFRSHSTPNLAIIWYLHEVLKESRERGYRFDETKLSAIAATEPIVETEGQLLYEWTHLLKKLERRSPSVHGDICRESPVAHPLFTIVPGAVQPWERITKQDPS